MFYIIFGIFTLLYFVVFCVVFVLTAAFDRDRRVLHRLSRLWTRCYFSIVPSWKVEIEGLENIDKSSQYVVTVNHRSMIDILLMYVLPLDFKWVAKREVYKWPLFGWVMRMHGDIAIERGTVGGIRKMVRQGAAWLSRGVSVIIFPEGTRSKSGKVGRFREGAYTMAAKAGVDVLPCVLSGTEKTFDGWRINFRNTFRVKVLPAIPAAEVAAADAATLARRMQELTAAEYEKIANR